MIRKALTVLNALRALPVHPIFVDENYKVLDEKSVTQKPHKTYAVENQIRLKESFKKSRQKLYFFQQCLKESKTKQYIQKQRNISY